MRSCAVRKEQDLTAVLLRIYDQLLAYFGPRGWWPAETPWEVMVGAVLTQNVAWRNVEQAIANLKQAGVLELEALYQAEEAQLAELIIPTRFYKTKARKLKVLAAYVMERYGGDLGLLFSRPLWDLREELLGLWGLGPETVDSILLYAGSYPIFVVDAYTRRIFSRLQLLPADATYQEMQEFFLRWLPPDVGLFNEYHALIDALGHHLCLAGSPRCAVCPLRAECRQAVNVEVSAGEGGKTCFTKVQEGRRKK